jgi:hypothetical protein
MYTGYFKNESGIQLCVQCPAGKYSAASGSSSCLQCEIGKYSPDIGASSSATCTDCPLDSSTISSGSSSSGDCVCLPGYAQAQDEACVRCDAGTFKDTKSDEDCRACPAGTFALFPAATFCRPCPAGFTSLPGSDEPDDCLCAPGSSGDLFSGCEACGPGKYGVGGSSACALCEKVLALLCVGVSVCARCASRRLGVSVVNKYALFLLVSLPRTMIYHRENLPLGLCPLPALSAQSANTRKWREAWNAASVLLQRIMKTRKLLNMTATEEQPSARDRLRVQIANADLGRIRVRVAALNVGRGNFPSTWTAPSV